MTRFARDAHGRIRPFTATEWAHVKQVGFTAIAPYFTEAELEQVIRNIEQDVARQQRAAARR